MIQVTINIQRRGTCEPHMVSLKSSLLLFTLQCVTAVNCGCLPTEWDPDMNGVLVCDQEECATACLGNANCVYNCMHARDPQYPLCGIDCAAGAAGCGLSMCFRECMLGCNDRCVRCTETKCSPAYADCLNVPVGNQPDGCCENILLLN